jgi:hypothetical protein
MAHVHLSYSRFKTLHLINGIWRNGRITDDMRASGEEAVSGALAAAEVYARNGIVRSIVIALNAASEAASALNDHKRLHEFAERAEHLANEYGYKDLAESSVRIRSRPTAVEGYKQAAHPPPVHKWDPAAIERMIEEMMVRVGLDVRSQEQVRPVLRAMVSHDVYLHSQREAVCRYLALLQDFRGPKIGPFEATPPKWRVACRLRGLLTVNENRNAPALIRRFTSAVCANCDLRSPAVHSEDFFDDNQDVFEPMFQWIRREGGRDG